MRKITVNCYKQNVFFYLRLFPVSGILYVGATCGEQTEKQIFMLSHMSCYNKS